MAEPTKGVGKEPALGMGYGGSLKDFQRQCEAYVYGKQMTDEQALKSYISKFVLARAPTFRVGHEVEDAWSATMHAKTSFKIMNQVVDSVVTKERREQAEQMERYRGGNQSSGHMTATEVMQRTADAARRAPKMQHLDPAHVKVWHEMLEKDMYNAMVYGGGMIPLGAEVKAPLGGGMSNTKIDESVTQLIKTKLPAKPFKICGIEFTNGDPRAWLQETRSLTPRQLRRLNRKQKAPSKA